MGKVKTKAFLSYIDDWSQIKELTDEELGQLTRAIYKYVATGEVEEPDNRLVRILFKGRKEQIDRDVKQYETKCENIKKAARKREENKRNGEQSCTNVDNGEQSCTNVGNKKKIEIKKK